jgi:hypothetical protein
MYGVVLFMHVCALLAAISAGALSHFLEFRMRSAETTGALRPWAKLLGRLGKVFPVALLILLASGAYLVHDAWSWSAGWVVASLVGVGLLFASGGGLVRARGVALRRALMAAGDGPLPPKVRGLIVRHPAAFASWMNTGLAVGIVFVMTAKPALAGSAAALVVGAAVGLGVAIGVGRRHA